MMITIHGFPAKTKYQDVKLLIKQECSINDFILDNLINDSDGTKKVRIGLTDNTEGYKVMKCLDGYRMPGNFVLKAIPVGKVASSVPPQPSSFDSRPSYQSQPKNDYSSAPRNDYMSQPANDYQGSLGTIPSHSHGGIHGSRPSQGGPHSGPHVSGGPQGTIDSMNRPSPWVSGGGSSNQWNTPMAAQVPQNTFGFTSPQANVNPSYGQQPVHPRPNFNQSRADQGYGYTPKSNVPEVVPENSRYRWVRKAEQEPTVSKPPHSDEHSASPSFADDIIVEKSQDNKNEPEKDPTNELILAETTCSKKAEQDTKVSKPPHSDKGSASPSFADDIFDENSQDIKNVSEKDPSNELTPAETKRSKKARKREQARLRDISKLNGAKRRRLYFWLKQGKPFMEARKLCEIGVKKIPEYPALKAEKQRKARERIIREMSPERQARAIKIDRLKGHGLPGAPVEPRPKSKPIRVRFVDELGVMSQEKIEMLQDKILELIDAEPDGNGTRFVGCAVSCGHLVLSCVDDQSVEWLENHLPDFQLWEGAQVKIVNLGQFFKQTIGLVYIADSDLSGEDVLNILKSHNEGIDFSDWWVSSTTPLQPAGQTVVFNIGDASVEKLAVTDNFLYLGTKRIKIRIRQNKPKTPAGEDQLPAKKEPKGKKNMPKGKWGMQPINKMGMPFKGQQGKPPKGQQGMPPQGQWGMPPKGQWGMQPNWQWGMQPKGQRGMPPKGQWGMQPNWQWGMQPMNQMDMLQMQPMDMGYWGPMDYVSTGPYPPDFSQTQYYGGGNQPKYYGGGKNYNNKQIQGGPKNNAGRRPKPRKRNKNNK